jgi:hypothetical protein
MQIKKIVSAQKEKLQTILSPQNQALGEIIFNNGQCQVLAQSVSRFELIVADERENEIAEYTLDIELPEEDGHEEAGAIFPHCDNEPVAWDKFAYA